MVLILTKPRSFLLAGAALILGSNDNVCVAAFCTSSSARTVSSGTRSGHSTSIHILFSKEHQYDQSSIDNPLSYESNVPMGKSLSECNRVGKQTTATTLAVSLAIAMATASTTLPVQPASAYVPTDYASDTVQQSIKDLKAASGNSAETFKVYESIAAIITEGKGVGGQINFKGVELQRGFVADEDTSIYNPGLTLLTESEKERLVEGVIDAHKAGLKADSKTNKWSEENEYAYTFLKTKLDPLYMTELRGFLGIVPYYAAAIYVAVTAVQQLFRESFQIAYLVGAAAFFLPIVGLVLAGP